MNCAYTQNKPFKVTHSNKRPFILSSHILGVPFFLGFQKYRHLLLFTVSQNFPSSLPEECCRTNEDQHRVLPPILAPLSYVVENTTIHRTNEGSSKILQNLTVRASPSQFLSPGTRNITIWRLHSESARRKDTTESKQSLGGSDSSVLESPGIT